MTPNRLSETERRKIEFFDELVKAKFERNGCFLKTLDRAMEFGIKERRGDIDARLEQKRYARGRGWKTQR